MVTPYATTSNKDLEPQLEFKAEAEITNLAWSTLQSDWLAICFKNTLQFLRV
jgi:hypothetical protein